MPVTAEAQLNKEAEYLSNIKKGVEFGAVVLHLDTVPLKRQVLPVPLPIFCQFPFDLSDLLNCIYLSVHALLPFLGLSESTVADGLSIPSGDVIFDVPFHVPSLGDALHGISIDFCSSESVLLVFNYTI